MRDVQISLKEVVASVDSDADWREFPLSLPFMRNLRIEFKTPVTFIVGENGAGKSTLMEGLVDLAIHRFYVWGKHPTMKKCAMLLSSYSPNVYDGALGQYRGMLRWFGAEDYGIVTSDNTTNKTPAKLEECYALGKGL